LFCLLLATSLPCGTSRAQTAKRGFGARAENRLNASAGNDRKIAPGDTLAFRVVEDEDSPSTLRVDAAGQVSVPYLGKIQAAGRSASDLASEIKRSLERSLYKQATVLVAFSRTPSTTSSASSASSAPARSGGRIYLAGEVNKQGPLDLPADESLTVSRAILRAGGFSEFANRKKVKLIRKKNGGVNTTVINVAAVVDQARSDLDPIVKSGDIIEVPQRLVNW
jgi:polysaccharide biosynthesis/export protein